jgi:hypothetical protein
MNLNLIASASYSPYYSQPTVDAIKFDVRLNGNGLRIPSISNILTKFIKGTKQPTTANLNIDSQTIPSSLQFYVQDKNTGVCSPLFRNGVRIAKRLKNMPLVLLPYTGK